MPLPPAEEPETSLPPHSSTPPHDSSAAAPAAAEPATANAPAAVEEAATAPPPPTAAAAAAATSSAAIEGDDAGAAAASQDAEEEVDSNGPWVVVASAQMGKITKDELKSRGWLSEAFKPTVGVAGSGTLAFPLIDGCVDDVRRAVADSRAADGEFGRSVNVIRRLPCQHHRRSPKEQQKLNGKKGGQKQQQGTAGGVGGGGGAGGKSNKRANASSSSSSSRPSSSGPSAASSNQPRSFGGGSGGRGASACVLPEAAAVRRVECDAGDGRVAAPDVFGRREPAVLRGLRLGPCVGEWTAERLARTECAAPAVSVHVCASSTVDLAGHRPPNTPRNFVFRSMPFAEAVARCSGASGGSGRRRKGRRREGRRRKGWRREGRRRDRRQPDGSGGAATPSASSSVRAVTRPRRTLLPALRRARPRKDTADFPKLFPQLAAECSLLPTATHLRTPPRPRALLDPSAYHSSVLRLASHDTQLWTHFDVMDNALAQVTGRKRVVLWPPHEDENLYVDGSSSRVADIDSWNDEAFPLWRRAVASRLECELAPGDVLFIPALWFHNVTSIGFSCAVNVFWRSHHHLREAGGGGGGGRLDLLDPNLYGKDLYGNKDPPAATRALELADDAVQALGSLPEPFRSFYARRASRSLLALCTPAAAPHPPAVAFLPPHPSTGDAAASDARSGRDDVGGGKGDGNGVGDASGGGTAAVRRAQLSSGGYIPLIGLGLYQLSRDEAAPAVRAALASGVRHFDCASIYRNEAEVGIALHEALAAGRVTRAELFVTGRCGTRTSSPRGACARRASFAACAAHRPLRPT